MTGLKPQEQLHSVSHVSTAFLCTGSLSDCLPVLNLGLDPMTSGQTVGRCLGPSALLPVPCRGYDPMGEYLRRAAQHSYFYAGFTRKELAFTPSQNAFEAEQTLGYKTCSNIPPSCPIQRLPMKYIHTWPLGSNHHSSLRSPSWIVDFSYPCPNSRPA